MNNIPRMAIYLAVTTILLVLTTTAYVLLADYNSLVKHLVLAVGIILSLFQIVILGEIIGAAGQKGQSECKANEVLKENNK